MNFIKLIIIICIIIINLNFIKSQTTGSPALDPSIHACGVRLLNDSITLTEYKYNSDGLLLICNVVFICEGLYITKVTLSQSTNNIITGDYFSCFYNLNLITLTNFKINNDFLSNSNDFKTPVSVSLITPNSDTFTSQLHPTIAPTIFSIDLSGRSLTGQLTESYCNVANLKLNNNLLTGTVPSCFLCYAEPGGSIVTNIFTGNSFSLGTYDYSTYVCDEVYATMRVNNERTKIYLEGTKLGFDASKVQSVPQLTWTIEQGSTRYVAPYTGPTDQIFITRITQSNKEFTLRSITRAPSTESVTVVYDGIQEIYTATFDGIDFGYDPTKITISFNEYPCVIISTNFYQLVCTINSVGNTIIMDVSMIVRVDLQSLPIKRFTYDYVNGGSGSNYKELVPCLNDCNSNGTCVNNFTKQTSACDCDIGNVGDDCHWPIQCSPICKFGECNVVFGVCECYNSNITGIDCSIVACNNTCLNGAVCDTSIGKCDCTDSYQGDDCSVDYIPCPTIDINLECSGFGSCLNQTGECVCDNSHQGDDCSTLFIQCPVGLDLKLCSGTFGSCNNVTGECSCDNSHQSDDCSVTFIQCPKGLNNELCSGTFGSCNNVTGECSCDNSHQSDDCSINYIACPSNTPKFECSGGGSCNNVTGECLCDQGKIYDDCSEAGIECTVQCLNGGVCNISVGTCKCPSNYIDNTCSTPVHYISSVDPCPSSGGQVVIYGWFSERNDGLTVTIGTLECSDIIVTSDNITCTLGVGTGTKDVIVTQNGSTFNGKKKFQYINTNNKCPKECSGQGICEPLYGQCTCASEWTGFDCASPKQSGDNDNIPQSITVINMESGISGISNQDTNYNIAILSLLEIDISNQPIAEHDLQSVEWNVTSDESIGKYNFIYQLPNSNCTISYTIQEIKQDTKYEFAGMKLSIDKGGLKVSVSILNYSYQSSLNTLQLRFYSISGITPTPSSEELDNKCNEKESIADTTSVDPDQTLNYISISKNSKILSGRFINRVVSDGRATFMSSEVVTSLSNSTSIVVGLNLPHCESSCLLDPDFSVLVSPDFVSECSPESSRKWVIPVAVVVPVVCVSAITGLCVALYKKYRYNIRLFTMKKSFSIRQSFKLRNFK